jgi:hypothetical protein
VKVFFVLLIMSALAAVYLFSSNTDPEQHIDDWAKQSAALFQDTASVFSSFKSDTPSEPTTDDTSEETFDEKLQNLLPSEELNLSYEPDFEGSTEIANGESGSILPSTLLPNLFDVKPGSNSASVKGQIFRDEKDKIIGAEVQLAIPTDM